MRRIRCRCRGLTITELLTVVSVITILTTMMSPVLIRVIQEGSRAKCSTNLRQIHEALELYANLRNGRLPQCFELNGTRVIENTWWFRKVAQVVYPFNRYYDYLTVPLAKSGNWNNRARTGGLQKFDPESCILRCPGSPDPCDENSSPKSLTKATGFNQDGKHDKDRVYDDNYGYNNTRFEYTKNWSGDALIHYYHFEYIDRCRLYHNPNDKSHGGGGSIVGKYVEEPPNPPTNPGWTYIGSRTEVIDPGGTILMMDYIKADVSIDNDKGTGAGELRDGYRFRHGGKASVLFVDGHCEGYREHFFRRALASDTIHWGVRLTP